MYFTEGWLRTYERMMQEKPRPEHNLVKTMPIGTANIAFITIRSIRNAAKKSVLFLRSKNYQPKKKYPSIFR